MTTAIETPSSIRTSGRPGLLSSLASQDRRLLALCLTSVLLVCIAGSLIAREQDDESPVPTSYSTSAHGAAAAYLALERSGYHIERGEQSLSELARTSDTHTTLILAGPTSVDDDAKNAIAQILDHGGRVIATGIAGADLLPGSNAKRNPLSAPCKAQPEGFGPLASAGTISLAPEAHWKTDIPDQHVEYMCGDDAVVVSYASGHGPINGHVIWWADSTPLENSAIAHENNLALLLKSIGPAEDARVIWDESLHGDQRGLWSYASGTPVHLLWAQLALVMALLVFSFSRRSGPLLPDPAPDRDAPLEFVQSLGALYDRAGATNLAVRTAYDRFCHTIGRSRNRQSTEEITGVLRSRLNADEAEVQRTITECSHAAPDTDRLTPRHALTLVQTLWDYKERIDKRTDEPISTRTSTTST